MQTHDTCCTIVPYFDVPEDELAKLREPLSNLNPQFFVLEYGFRK